MAIPIFTTKEGIAGNNSDNVADRTEYYTTAKNLLVSGADAMERLMTAYKVSILHTRRFGDQSVHFRISQILGKMSQISVEMREISGEMSQISGEKSQISGENSQYPGKMSQMFCKMSQISGKMSQISGKISQLSSKMTQISDKISQILAKVYTLIVKTLGVFWRHFSRAGGNVNKESICAPANRKRKQKLIEYCRKSWSWRVTRQGWPL